MTFITDYFFRLPYYFIRVQELKLRRAYFNSRIARLRKKLVEATRSHTNA